VNVSVKLFAKARDLAGSDLVEIEVPSAARASDVRRALGERFPALRPVLSNLLLAGGADYATAATPIDPDSDLAFFPPVWGG
jgi:molybdopterin converting factor small subunit